MPFAGYDNFDACVRENTDKDDPEAYCAAIKQEVEGELTDEEQKHYSRLGADTPPPHRFLQADFSGLPTVRRTQEGDDMRYENLVLIGAGEWTDANGNTEYYSERALRKIAEDPDEMVVDTSVNVNHEHRDQLLQVGHIDRDSLAYKNGLLLGDIVLYGDKQAGKDVIADMNRALESDGEHGAGGFSIQIPNGGFTRKFNSERGIYELTEFKLAGGGIVTEGASGPANLDEQLPQRAVALSAEGDSADVRVLGPGDTTKAAMRQPTGMDPITDVDDLRELGEDAELLFPADSDEPTHVLAEGETVSIDIEGASIEQIREALGGREAAGDMDVSSALDEFLANDGSPEDGVDVFLEWARANTDADIDALESAAADYLAQSDAEDLSETPVADFMAFVEGEGGGEGPEEGGEDEEMGGEMASEIQEHIRELRAELDDAYQRIETLEDRPDFGKVDAGDDDEEEPAPADTLTGLARDGDYISR